MSELDAALAGLRTMIAAIPQRHALPSESQRATHKAMLAITNGEDRPPPVPQPDRLDQVWSELQHVSLAQGDFSSLPPRTLRDAAWLLWDRRRGAVELPGLLPALLTRSETNTSMLRRLIEAWLRDFRPGLREAASVGEHIARMLHDKDLDQFGRWREAHSRFKLFDAATGPTRLANSLLDAASLTPLQQIRLDAPMRASGGFMRAVAAAFDEELPKKMCSANAAAVLEVARAFYAPNGKLRFDEPKARGTMADAMVGAWIDGAGPEVLRADVLAFLRLHLGDPRVSPPRWAQANDRTLRVVRGWLAQLTLDAFFNVIGQFAAKGGFDLTWQHRKAFWSACLRKGWIGDSWLALGPNVASSVAVNQELRGSFARLEGAADRNHSVLLMQIGKLVFAEWSHNGRLRAWLTDGRNAPPLSPTSRYDAESLRAPGLKFPRHFNSAEPVGPQDRGLAHLGNWQARVAALLREQEGLRLQPTEWV